MVCTGGTRRPVRSSNDPLRLPGVCGAVAWGGEQRKQARPVAAADHPRTNEESVLLYLTIEDVGS